METFTKTNMSVCKNIFYFFNLVDLIYSDIFVIMYNLISKSRMNTQIWSTVSILFKTTTCIM